MDSDSDHFESADEEFVSDHEEDYKHSQKNINRIQDDSSNVTPILNVKNISLENSNKDSTSKKTSSKINEKEPENEQTEQKQENCNVDSVAACNLENNTSPSSNISHDKNNANINETNTGQKQKPRVIERRERPQKSREPKARLGVKLGTKITENKDQAFWGAYSEAKKNEYAEPPKRVTCWEEDVDWGPIETDTKISEPKIKKQEPEDSNLYSEKFTPDKNFWENEEDYMELPREEKKCSTYTDSTNKEDSAGGWGGWGNWGMSSLLSSAQLGVSTITNSVSQGITTVLETGIGVPDPEELARLDREEKQKQNENPAVKKQEVEPEESRPENYSQRGFGLGNFVSGVTHITKLVETTGTKVLTGGLDTLEVIGKKTMEVLQEGDPGLKKKRALFKIDQDKPVLSQMLREAKEKAEQENKFLEEKHIAKKPHYETMFDDYQGLVHLEALEMLSKQCDIKLETLLESLSGNALTDMQETMAQIKELCELPDEEEDITCDIESVREKVESAITEMNIQITYSHFLESWTEIDEWLQDSNKTNEDDIHQKAIESLAQLTAIAVEQFHKAGELLLVKERRSTVDEADSLVQLTITLTGVIGAIAGKFSEKLNGSNSDNVNSLITNIFLEAANSSSYIQDAFNLMIPVLQVGAV